MKNKNVSMGCCVPQTICTDCVPIKTENKTKDEYQFILGIDIEGKLSVKNVK